MAQEHALLVLVAAAALCLVALVLVVAALHWFRSQPGVGLGAAPWRRDDADALKHTLGWVSTLALGLLTSAVLVVLSAVLTWQVALGSMRVPAVAPAAASGAVNAAVEPKDAVSNVMTAVALVLAAVTLVLTVGTTWLGGQQRALEAVRARLDASLREVEQWKDLERQRLAVDTLLPRAVLAAKVWVGEQGASDRMWISHVLGISYHLQVLSADDRSLRGLSFDFLAQFFDGADDLAALGPVVAYCEACHQLALARAWHHKEVGNPLDLRRIESAGIWCRCFDEQEVARRLGAA